MYLDQIALKALVNTLHEVRRTRSFFCPVQRLGPGGETDKFTVKDPKQAKKLNEQGLLAVRTGPDGKQHGVLTPHGPHGTSYIQINPETGEIRCGACAGDLDSTVRE